jgi:hypothetical protein
MRFYWIRDRVAQGQFNIYWRKGSKNLADNFTKHHPPAHHQRMRLRYLQQTDHGQKKKDTVTTGKEKCVHSEGVLNNIRANTAQTDSHPNYPILNNVPLFPSMQPGLNALPACSQAQLTNSIYWPIPASILVDLVQKSSS